VTVTNTLSSVIPTLYAQGFEALRSGLVMPRLVTNDFGDEVKNKGEIIQIPLPSAMTSTPIVPAAYAPDPQNVAPTTATIPLDYWDESAFTLTNKEYAQVVAGVVPIQLTAAMQSLAATINASIIGLYTTVGNYVGVAGTTPFAFSEGTPTEAIAARTILSQNLAPVQDRALVLGPAAFGNALGLPNFAYYLNAGDKDSVDAGTIDRKFGFNWYEDQQIGNAVGGGAVTGYQTAGALTGTVTASATQAAGLTAIAVTTGASSSFAPNVGDIVTFAGDSQTYSVQSGGVASSGLGASASGTLNILPAKQVAIGGSAVAITMKASHVVNLAFQRQAFGFAMRPEAEHIGGKDPDMRMTMTDPVSGISMTMEIRDEFHRTRVAYSALWGVGAIRPQVACRIAG
jgi:hypothetical protein